LDLPEGFVIRSPKLGVEISSPLDSPHDAEDPELLGEAGAVPEKIGIEKRWEPSLSIMNR
jgi:hypothetical protein